MDLETLFGPMYYDENFCARIHPSCSASWTSSDLYLYTTALYTVVRSFVPMELSNRPIGKISSDIHLAVGYIPLDRGLGHWRREMTYFFFCFAVLSFVCFTLACLYVLQNLATGVRGYLFRIVLIFSFLYPSVSLSLAERVRVIIALGGLVASLGFVLFRIPVWMGTDGCV